MLVDVLNDDHLSLLTDAATPVLLPLSPNGVGFFVIENSPDTRPGPPKSKCHYAVRQRKLDGFVLAVNHLDLAIGAGAFTRTNQLDTADAPT